MRSNVLPVLQLLHPCKHTDSGSNDNGTSVYGSRGLPLIHKQKQTHRSRSVNCRYINCLRVTPTHDAYLDNGTLAGLTVDTLIIAYES